MQRWMLLLTSWLPEHSSNAAQRLDCPRRGLSFGAWQVPCAPAPGELMMNEVSLADAIPTAADQMAGKTRGRVVVDVNN